MIRRSQIHAQMVTELQRLQHQLERKALDECQLDNRLRELRRAAALYPVEERASLLRLVDTFRLAMEGMLRRSA